MIARFDVQIFTRRALQKVVATWREAINQCAWLKAHTAMGQVAWDDETIARPNFALLIAQGEAEAS